MVAVVFSTLMTLLMTFGAYAYMSRRPHGQKASWGEAIAGSVYVSFVAYLAFGIVPHQWLQYAENERNWTGGKFLYGPFDIVKPISQGGWFPFDLTYRAISDIIATNFYVVFVAIMLSLWKRWQFREKMADEKAKAQLARTSSFGRPLIKQG